MASVSNNKSTIYNIRRLAGVGLALVFALAVIAKTGGITVDPFIYHPIAFAVMFLGVMPEMMMTVAMLKKKSTTPVTAGPRVDKHQFTAFLLQLCAAAGFGAVEYVKITKGYPHFRSPHSIVGTICGVAIVLQVIVGAALRYVISATCQTRATVVSIHGVLSLTISVTGLMCFIGGMTQTPFAVKMVPSTPLRCVLGFGAPVLMAAGYMTA